jgi:hypothetical protein
MRVVGGAQVSSLMLRGVCQQWRTYLYATGGGWERLSITRVSPPSPKGEQAGACYGARAANAAAAWRCTPSPATQERAAWGLLRVGPTRAAS